MKAWLAAAAVAASFLAVADEPATGLTALVDPLIGCAFNGRPVEGFILKHADLVRGGELVFEME